MNDPRTVVVTGVAGNLGRRLLPLLNDARVVGVDVDPLGDHPEIELRPLDLGRESSCVQLVKLLRECRAEAVVHLAFATEPLRAGTAETRRMWQTNVAGVGRVMEAIAEVNRHGGEIRKFIYPSSVAVYGPATEPLVDESAPLAAHSLPYALHKAEADGVVRFRAANMGECSSYLLRPHVFAGASMQNCVIDAIRGCAYGSSAPAQRMRERGRRLPLLLPMGSSYLQKLFQFVHVDDVARLIAWLLARPLPEEPELQVLNVAGSGEPVSLARCAEIAQARLLRLPSRWLCTKAMGLTWKSGLSRVPPEAFPYICGSYTVSTERLRKLLGPDYSKVIQYSSEAALADSFRESAE